VIGVLLLLTALFLFWRLLAARRRRVPGRRAAAPSYVHLVTPPERRGPSYRYPGSRGSM
jgi:hypothetical protein